MKRKEEMCSMRTPSDRYNEKKGSVRERVRDSVKWKQSERAHTTMSNLYRSPTLQLRNNCSLPFLSLWLIATVIATLLHPLHLFICLSHEQTVREQSTHTRCVFSHAPSKCHLSQWERYTFILSLHYSPPPPLAARWNSVSRMAAKEKERNTAKGCIKND